MSNKSLLDGKLILAVDDESDVLELVSEQLDMCTVHTALDYDTAIQYLLSYSYDFVILDIMGVNGFDLLKQCVHQKIPTLMLTAHALTPDSVKLSMKLGAVSLLPKEELSQLETFLEEVVLNEGKPVWRKLFDRIGHVFDRRFGPDWKEKDQYIQDFIRSIQHQGL